MNREFNRRAMRKVLAVSISAIGVTAFVPAMAQTAGASEEVQALIRPDSEVSVGVLDVSRGSYKFGDYTGMHKKGSHLNADVRINKRGENNANYFELNGRDLGLDSRNLQIRGGEQGSYGLSFEYDEIHKLWSDSYQTPYLGAGSTNLTLPAGWVSSTVTGTMTTLPASMRSFNIETERKSATFGLTKVLPSNWDVAVKFKHETKQGNRLIGGTIGNSGGNPRGAVLPEPVDYVTRQVDAIARYTTDKLQVQLAYYGSLFDDKKTSLVFQNAFNGATWGAGVAGIVGYPNGFGQLALPPDNQAHQVSALVGYQLTEKTRLAGSLSFGRMTQNESFLPYTVNTGLTSPLGLPRTSLDGKVNTTHLDIKLTSKLDPKLNLVALYRYDDRANKTPQAAYTYIGGDSQNQTAFGGGKTRTNLPGSSTKQLLDVELDYRMAPHTKLKMGYGYDWAKKTFEAITSEWEHSVKGEVHQQFSDTTSGGLAYTRSNRETSNYDGSSPYYASFDPAYIAATTPKWDNNPFQKKFFEAPRVRDKIRAFLDFEPLPMLNVHLGLDYKNDNYKESYYGLKKLNGWAQHFNANYVASDALTGHVFATVNQNTSFEKSNTLGNAPCGVANPTASQCEWGAELIDRGLTGGFGLSYKPGTKYEVGFDYTHAAWRGTTNMSISGNSTLGPITALPDNTTKMDRIDLFGRYQLQKDMTVNVKYIYERYRAKDWAFEGVLSNTLANVIGTNEVVPNYSVHAVGVVLNYQFQ